MTTIAPPQPQAAPPMPARSFTPARVPLLLRKCACGGSSGSGGECADCKKKKTMLQRHAAGSGGVSSVPPVVHSVLNSPGRPLDAPTRSFMEQRFGHDFSQVRIHTDSQATESAASVNALAYTVREHIVFQSGQYNPDSTKGRRLLAHELSHVLQQSPAVHPAGELVPTAQAKLAINTPGDRYEQEADRIAEEVVGSGAMPSNPVLGTTFRISPALQRQPQPAPACPTVINFTANDPVHVPSCGPFRAQTNVAGITWSLAPDPTAVDPGTTIAANGTITIAATQAAGQLKAVATAPSGCFFERSFRVRSHPTGIAGTFMVSMSANPVNDYGAVFDHTFVSADGNVASLDNVAVGERFVGVPTPAADTHNINAPMNPFGGTFTLRTATLTPNATNNWFLTAAGQLGGTHDNVTIGRANINVGRFVQSASNLNPPQGLPANMTLTQGLHWFCPQAAANRWRMPAFVTVAHSRTLRNRGGNVEFVTTVNGVEVSETYSGPLAVFNLTPSPASTPRSPAPPPAPPGGAAPAAPPARTVQITVDSLPSAIPAGQSIAFSLIGNARGCTIAADPANDHAAVLTIGQGAGTVTVQAADPTGVNRARVNVVIT